MTTALKAPDKPTREFAIASLTGVLRNAAESLPEEIAVLTIEELETKRKPTQIDFFLRKNLWKQVELVQKGAFTEIDAVDIYRGVCARNSYENLAKNPERVAWLLIHPSESHDRAEAGFEIGLTNLLKFVAKEPTAETAGAFLKAMEMLWNRVHGPVVQRIDSRHATLNLNKPIAKPPGKENRLEELKAKLESRDVTPEKLNPE